MTQTQDIFGTAREMGFEITEGPISQGRVVILRQNDGGGHEAWMWVDEDGQTILEDQGDGTCHLPIPDEAVASTLAGYAE